MSNSMRIVTSILLILASLIAVASIIVIVNRDTFSKRNSVASVAEKENFLLSTETEIAPEQKEVQPIRLLFGGDLMFDRNIRLAAQKNSYQFILSELDTLFWSHDLVIANLEGPVTEYESESVGSTPGSTKNFIFTFDPQVAPLLKEHNIQLVNLGNNHILNFGQDGLEQTRKYLAASAVSYFGNVGEGSSTEQTSIQTIQNVKIGFVNYNQFTADGLEQALADIAHVNNAVDLVIVYTHWGLEYQPEANQVIKNIATELQEAGADLIIGSHPHVVQQYEDLELNGDVTRVYYSLGNFVFDQYFEKAVQNGLFVSVTIDPTTYKMEFQEHHIQLMPNGQTVLIQ